MIKVYAMHTCPDCRAVEDKIKGNPDFEIIEIGSHVKLMKEFIRLRDKSPVFDEARKEGYIGIPCFVKEDGTVTLNPADVGISE